MISLPERARPLRTPPHWFWPFPALVRHRSRGHPIVDLLERIPVPGSVSPIDLPRFQPEHRKAIDVATDQPTFDRKILSKHPGASTRSNDAPTSPDVPSP